MGARVRIKLDSTEKILLKRSLNNNGAAQRFFTHEVRRMCDPYVPFRSGPLKNTAVESISKITYGQPYARRQYYEHKGNGLRGPKWDKRMWPTRGPQIVKAVANFAGGKSE